MVIETILVSTSATFCLARIRFRAGKPGRLGQMAWCQFSTWSLCTASIKWFPARSAWGDHVEERGAIRKPVNIGCDEFERAA